MDAMTPTQHADALESVLDEHRDLYGQLDALSQRQRGLIDSGRTDELLSVLTERQGVVDAICEAGQRLEPLRQGWDRLLELLPEPRSTTLKRRVESLARLARDIAERDEADRRTLESQRGAASGELRQVSSAQRAARAYGQPRQGAIYQDREG